jgi:HSP20 family protein
MSVVKWNPFRELAAFQHDMDRLFSRWESEYGRGTLGRMIDGGEVNGRQSWMLATDVLETKEALVVKAAVPGIDPQHINVQVEDNVLTISGERQFERVEDGQHHWTEQQYGSFSRAVSLPPYADVARITARYNHGVIELTIPKREESKPRKIELNLGESASSEPRAIEAGADTTMTSQNSG